MKRYADAVIFGIANATFVAVLSIVLKFPHVWPGTILCFVQTTAWWLLFRKPRGRR